MINLFAWAFWQDPPPPGTTNLFWELLGQKKVVLFPEIDRVEIFVSSTRPHKSNVYENVYFCFKKTHTHKQKNFHQQIYSHEFTFFSLQKI